MTRSASDHRDRLGFRDGDKRWRAHAAEHPRYAPAAVRDPREWTCRGEPSTSDARLHVAVARLLGYRWPDQQPDALDAYADKDGEGLSALVNDHKLDHEGLKSLTNSYPGDWLRIREIEAKAGKSGAGDKLARAKALQQRLATILEGEAPLDVFVRWKPNIQWGTDRRKNPPGSPWGEYRDNDRHLALAEKRAARGET